MSTNTTTGNNRVMAVLTAIAALLTITVVPLLLVGTMDAVLKGAAVKIPASGNPLIATAPQIVITFFPIWGGLCMAAGVALLLVSKPLSGGAPWARPVAVGLLAIPSITGAYLSGPTMFFAQNVLPNFIVIALIGLIPYFTLLLWDKASVGEKIGRFFLFLMLGVTAAWSFSNGGSSLRMLMARPEPYVLDSGGYGFALGIPVVWIGVVCVMVAIPLLVARTTIGRRLGASGLLIILAGSTTLFITHPGTKEFLAGIVMAIVTFVLLAIPPVGQKLLPAPSTEQG